ncbi:HrpE/YscL family type III secretion apparatus protein [Paramixta manurensis]|uniref:HrpE/YscL family type III secretion apparatus protein n=1 Tax=Paramixta manurensis TaxID=2740817 RepID=A0A6M8U6N6_9GAMM|nr:HrpE/YscL family type III secretion apparatus protein [Erwiniaceae bacterium PD-1]
MWITKQITLTTLPPLEEGVVLSRETLHEYQQAYDVLTAAQQRHAQIVADAERQAQQIIEAAHDEAARQIAAALAQSEAQFLQRVETLFEDWQSARKQQDESLISQAQYLVSAALTHLFDSSSDTQKVTALLRQLLQARARGQSATLWCHPSQYAAIEAWLQAHTHLDWAVQLDDALEIHSVMLQTANGELSVNWAQLQQRLLSTVQA